MQRPTPHATARLPARPPASGRRPSYALPKSTSSSLHPILYYYALLVLVEHHTARLSGKYTAMSATFFFFYCRQLD